MLLFALALANALPAAEPPQHRRKARARGARVTRIPARAAPPPRPRAIAGPAAPARRYRLPLPSTEVTDAKRDAVRNTGMACGTTGAPVCPQTGRQVLKSSLD
jgi:hypothetical protein